MSLSIRRRWSLVFGMGIFAIVASGIGVLKTHGGDGEHFGSLFAGVVIVAAAASAVKKPE